MAAAPNARAPGAESKRAARDIILSTLVTTQVVLDSSGKAQGFGEV
jgi:hypothetical protein